MAAGSTIPFVFNATGGDFTTNCVLEVNDNNTIFGIFGNGRVNAGAAFTIANQANIYIDASGFYAFQTGTTAGDDSRFVRFTSYVVGNVARNITLKNEGDAGTDTYRLRFNDNASAQILALESTGQIKAVQGSVTVPTYTFASDPDTGVYRNGLDAREFLASCRRIHRVEPDDSGFVAVYSCASCAVVFEIE